MYAIAVIPGIVLNYNPQSKMITTVLKSASNWTIVSGALASLGKSVSYTPIAGNYIKTVSTYTATGLKVEFTVYRSKTSSVIEHTSTVTYNFR